MNSYTVAAQIFTHLSVVSSSQRLYGRLRCEGKSGGYTNITVVKEQEQPDGNFPTCPYPNPEIKETMALGMEYAKKCNADLLLATDPDCDRVGIAVKNTDGEFVLLNGNQTGSLLVNYMLTAWQEKGKLTGNEYTNGNLNREI